MPGSLVDSNIWVAATFPTHSFHAPSQTVLIAATREQPALFCRATEQSYLRLMTSPPILALHGAEGMTNGHALAALDAVLSRPEIESRDEPAGAAPLWHKLANRNSASPKVGLDAYLAAFAIAGDLDFVTLDRDFQAYETRGLRLRLLAPPSDQ